MRAAALCLIAACALAGCGEPAAPPPPADAPVERPAPPPAAAPTPWTGGPLAVSAAGVGPLTAATAFDRTAIAALFPQALVETGFLQFGPSTWPQIIIEQGEVLDLAIVETAPGQREIHITGGQAVGPDGETLMTKWPDARFEISQCAAGEGRDVNALVCRRPAAPNIAYVFGIPEWVGDGVPPAATLNEKAFIREIVWTSPAAPAPAPAPASTSAPAA